MMLSWDAMMAPSESHCVFHGEARHFEVATALGAARAQHKPDGSLNGPDLSGVRSSAEGGD
jgi:hypothetical protein